VTDTQPVERETRKVKATRSASQPTERLSVTQGLMDIDWLTWALVLMAVLFLGGLIPFWVWIYMLYNSPIK
jgi:hypothetical protein